ncbi:N-acetylmuramoyl-L-alanine amidase [Nocardia terpenica]|uniref:N-acetylmuramoyl-L-alanine amidase n=1 Tax=Nocardia terpenica TaxID=455432 RepID=UPI003A5C1CDD
MKQPSIIVCVAATAAALASTAGLHPAMSLAAPATPEVSTKLAGKTVFLDPGHQGPNHTEDMNRQVANGYGGTKPCQTTGMTTVHGVPEHTVNWNVAQLVKQSLETLGARVVLSRQDDTGWGGCVDERAAAANRSGADVAISIHADSAPAQDHGFHFIVPQLPTADEKASRVQSGAGLAATKAVRDAYRTAGFTPADYAGAVDGLMTRNDIAGPALTEVPDVFVEMGNGANADDATSLENQDGQIRHAIAITTGLASYLLGAPSQPPVDNLMGRSPNSGSASGAKTPGQNTASAPSTSQFQAAPSAMSPDGRAQGTQEPKVPPLSTGSADGGAGTGGADQSGTRGSVPGANQGQGQGSANQGQTGAGQTVPGQPGGAQTAPGQSGAGQAVPGAGQAVPDQSGSGQVVPGQFGAGQTVPGAGQVVPQSGSSQAAPGQPGASQVVPGQPGAGQVVPGQPGAGQVAPGQSGAGQSVPGQLGAGQVEPGQANLGEGGSGQTAPGGSVPGQQSDGTDSNGLGAYTPGAQNGSGLGGQNGSVPNTSVPGVPGASMPGKQGTTPMVTPGTPGDNGSAAASSLVTTAMQLLLPLAKTLGMNDATIPPELINLAYTLVATAYNAFSK